MFFKVALSSAYIPHTTKVESQTVRSELHHNLGLAPTVSFLLLFLGLAPTVSFLLLFLFL